MAAAAGTDADGGVGNHSAHPADGEDLKLAEETDGVVIVTLHAGDATNYPKDGNTVRCHYETLIQGENIKIDSSRDRKAPLEFRVGLGQVIPGLDVAMKRMSRGQRAKITIPAPMAYGSRGYPPIIPPGSTLIMDVELLSFA